MIRRLICLIIAAAVLPFAVLADDDWVPDMDDLIIEEVTEYDDVAWDFPINLNELEPELIILANKTMLISKDFVVKPLVKMKTRKANKDGSNANGGVRKASGGEMQLSQVCAEALVRMFEAAEQDGIKLYLKSAYRSYQTQKTMYYNRLKKYGYDDGYVAMPGGSDHQTGLGCDVVSYAWRDKGMTKAFGKTDEAKWMAEHCAEYGFVIRYPADKEDVTAIAYEPWHLRYVGAAAAAYLTENGLCLEEFRQQLDDAIETFIANGGRRAIVEPYMQVSAE